MGWSAARLVHDPNPEMLHQFSCLLSSDSHLLCDRRFCAIVRSTQLPWCQVVLATPNDAPGLVIGGIIYAHLPQSELSYIAVLYVRADFRGKRIGRMLFEEFQRSVSQSDRIAFCDFARSERARLRPTLFPVEGRYFIRKLTGYAENIALAGAELIAAHDKIEDDDSLPEVCSFPGSLDMNNIVAFDAKIAGRNRKSALKELCQLDGFEGLAAISGSGDVIGYAISMPGVGSRVITVGPLYAVNLITAVCLLRDLCCAVSEDNLVTIHVPHMGHRMLRFLHDKALCEVDMQFDRFYTKDVEIPVDDFSKVFAVSAQILMPDC